MEIHIFPGKYHQNGSFSMAMLVYRCVVEILIYPNFKRMVVMGHGVCIHCFFQGSFVLSCNKFAPAKLRCVEETIEVPHEIAELDWTKFGLFASSHTCLLSIPFPYSKHQHPCAVALAGGC